MSVQRSLGITRSVIDRIVDERWSAWAAEHPQLPPAIGSSTELYRWLRTGGSDLVDQALRTLAMRAHVDDYDDADAAIVLASAMLPAAALIAHQLHALDPDIDAHVAAHLWIQVRTTPWRLRGRIAIGLRWRIWRQVVGELSWPEALEGAVAGNLDLRSQQSVDGDTRCDDDELLELLSAARRSGELSDDDVELLVAVLDASSAAVPGKARGAALLGDRVSEAVAPMRGASPRHVRRQTRSCIEALRRLACA